MEHYSNNQVTSESKSPSIWMYFVICVVIATLVFLFFYNKKTQTQNIDTEEKILIEQARNVRNTPPIVELTEEEKTVIINQGQALRQEQKVEVQLSEQEKAEILNQFRNMNQ